MLLTSYAAYSHCAPCKSEIAPRLFTFRAIVIVDALTIITLLAVGILCLTHAISASPAGAYAALGIAGVSTLAYAILLVKRLSCTSAPKKSIISPEPSTSSKILFRDGTPMEVTMAQLSEICKHLKQVGSTNFIYFINVVDFCRSTEQNPEKLEVKNFLRELPDISLDKIKKVIVNCVEGNSFELKLVNPLMPLSPEKVILNDGSIVENHFQSIQKVLMDDKLLESLSFFQIYQKCKTLGNAQLRDELKNDNILLSFLIEKILDECEGSEDDVVKVIVNSFEEKNQLLTRKNPIFDPFPSK